jgi:sarcosine/dimethylglycine N-methyltransferase
MATSRGGFQDRIVERYDAPMYRAMLEVYGDQIHPGFLRSAGEDPVVAARRPTVRLAELAGIRSGQRVLETACGVGGTARLLARERGATVVATNISRGQLATARESTAPGLPVTFEFADFHALPYGEAAFDVYLCQDSFVYASDRRKALAEAFRVLRPGATLALSDLLAVGPAPSPALAATLRALSEVGFWSFAEYREAIADAGFVDLREEDWSAELAPGFRRVAEEIARKRESLAAIASEKDVEETIARYALWCRVADAGVLGWGAFVARKP